MTTEAVEDDEESEEEDDGKAEGLSKTTIGVLGGALFALSGFLYYKAR